MVPSSMRVLDVVGAWARWLLGECFFLFEFVVFVSKLRNTFGEKDIHMMSKYPEQPLVVK